MRSEKEIRDRFNHWHQELYKRIREDITRESLPRIKEAEAKAGVLKWVLKSGPSKKEEIKK